MTILNWYIELWLVFLVAGGVLVGAAMTANSKQRKPKKEWKYKYMPEYYSNARWIYTAMKLRYNQGKGGK